MLYTISAHREHRETSLAQLPRVLREEKILKVVREGSGRRAQVLALAQLIDLAEGRTVI